MESSRRRHARGRGRLATLLLLLAVVPASGLAGRAAVSTVLDGRVTPRPALPVDAAEAPLRRPDPPPAGTGGYAFLGAQDDGSRRPVRWDACRPVHYIVRPDGAPPGGEAAIDRAAAEVGKATGLVFVNDGTTTEAPSDRRRPMDVPRYGDRWSPVLVAWTDPAEHPAIAGFAGLGGPDSVSSGRPGTRRYVSGVVLLNAEHLSQVVQWQDGSRRMQAVVLHEFGHLVGLDHVDDPNELMVRKPTALSSGWGEGDRRGLALLGLGPCFRDF